MYSESLMAGMVRIELTHDGVKGRCLNRLATSLCLCSLKSQLKSALFIPS